MDKTEAGRKETREEQQPRFAIGQRFKTRGKHPRVGTITDIHRTYNAAGELVRLRYVAQFEFMGQTLTERDICDTTIAMGAMP